MRGRLAEGGIVIRQTDEHSHRHNYTFLLSLADSGIKLYVYLHLWFWYKVSLGIILYEKPCFNFVLHLICTIK